MRPASAACICISGLVQSVVAMVCALGDFELLNISPILANSLEFADISSQLVQKGTREGDGVPGNRRTLSRHLLSRSVYTSLEPRLLGGACRIYKLRITYVLFF